MQRLIYRTEQNRGSILWSGSTERTEPAILSRWADRTGLQAAGTKFGMDWLRIGSYSLLTAFLRFGDFMMQ